MSDINEGPAELSQEDTERLLRHLMLPIEVTLPSDPFDFLSAHVGSLPEPLAVLFSPVTTPRQRTAIPRVKSRRLTYACTVPPPAELQAESGRRRWPLLWERMGGDRGPLPVPAGRPDPVNGLDEEERFGSTDFMDGRLDSQAVKRLGGLLRDYEEEREAERGREARRAERQREEGVGEEFDEESDEEELEEQRRRNGVEDADQMEVRELFEKKLAELFIDGLDTIDYDPIDFVEPAAGDPIGDRDQEDRYFEEEDPVDVQSGQASSGLAEGEYDY